MNCKKKYLALSICDDGNVGTSILHITYTLNLISVYHNSSVGYSCRYNIYIIYMYITVDFSFAGFILVLCRYSIYFGFSFAGEN